MLLCASVLYAAVQCSTITELDRMSDEVVEVVGSVDDLEDGQYVDISPCLLFNYVVFSTYVYFTDV